MGVGTRVCVVAAVQPLEDPSDLDGGFNERLRSFLPDHSGGGAGRGGGFETKKAYKVYFRGTYGDKKLNYPIIPETEVDVFDKLVLRSGFNDSYRTSSRSNYLRDELIRDLHDDMGALAGHGSWCVLFVNMKFRGLYNIVERMDEEFASSYFEDEDWDPYAVRPEDALMAARTAVKDWRLAQITTVKRQAHLDPVTEFFVLAWDAFRAVQFPADEALKLSRVVGISFDGELRNRILEVKGGDVILWDSALRAQKGSLGSADGHLMLDALHQAARLGREQNTGAARDLIEKARLLSDQAFLLALEAALNVLPSPQMVTGSAAGPLVG
ncbi:MAG: CotH kinase family protein, partial [Gemmatimonadetes bacterium]|nr:CotH kinase family protein [Gemmatimonadota bacterium]